MEKDLAHELSSQAIGRLERAGNDIDRATSILRHIQAVERNMNRLANFYMRKGGANITLGLTLLNNARLHDIDKLSEPMFTELDATHPNFLKALERHRKNNYHHPEKWPSIHAMENIFIMEMVCDCLARSQEMGTNIREWFENEATAKYNFSMDQNVGKRINEYLDILLTPVFSNPTANTGKNDVN